MQDELKKKIKGKIYEVSDEDFINIVSDSYSLAEVTKMVGYKTYKSGGGRQKVKDRILSLNLDINHFKPVGRQYEKPPVNKIINPYDVFKKSIVYVK